MALSAGVGALVGVVGLRCLEHLTTKALPMWTAVAVLVAVVSLLGPLSATTVAATATLIGLHAVVAGVVIVAARRSRRRNSPSPAAADACHSSPRSALMAGYAATVMIVTLGMLLAAIPLARSGPFGVVSWALSDLVNESPSLGLGYLLLATLPLIAAGDLGKPGMLAWFLVGCASFLVTPLLLARSAQAREVLRGALDDGLGASWAATTASAARAWRGRLPWARIAVFPIPVFPLGVRRRRGLRYGPSHRNRLDVYCDRGHESGRPVLIHLHGGGFRTGRKSLYARPLLHAFARNGWVCISASYRLRPVTYVEDAHRRQTGPRLDPAERDPFRRGPERGRAGR